MKVYVYLDESGSIHKNSKTRYFAVGGYFVLSDDKNKVSSLYKRINKKIKEDRNISLSKEIKSYDMQDEEKILIFDKMQKINTFYGCAKVFDKEFMKKEIIHSNIFFNYAVKLLFEDHIIPLLKSYEDGDIEFILSIDNRNIRVGDLKNLENYLKTEFCLKNYDFKVKYYDSSFNYGVQLADLIVNTFYNSYKDINIVKKVVPFLKKKKFNVSVFPSYKVKKKIDKTFCKTV